jgi:Cu/Ag efflux pump CusA
VHGRAVDTVAAEVRDAIGAMVFPLEYHAELVGDPAQRQSAHLQAITVVIAALIGVFLFLQAAFASWKLATLSFLALPLAWMGGVLALVAGNRVLSLGARVGFLAVLAIAVRNCVTLIRRYQQLERDEGEAFGPDLVVRGSLERFVPIVTTTVAVASVLLPFVLWGGEAGEEVVHPMAIVILAGLLTSTVLNLFVIPSICARSWPRSATEQPPTRPAVTTIPDIEQVPGA